MAGAGAAVAGQHPVHRRPAPHRPAAHAELVDDPPGPPPRMLPPQLADQGLGSAASGGLLRGRRNGPLTPTCPPARTAATHSATAVTSIPGRDLPNGEPPKHLPHRPVPVLHQSLLIHGPPNPAASPHRARRINDGPRRQAWLRERMVKHVARRKLQTCVAPKKPGTCARAILKAEDVGVICGEHVRA